MTTVARDELKAAIVRRLAEVAFEHPAGHQGKLAARFILRSVSGEGIELMFEKGPASVPNLWMLRKYAEPLMTSGIDLRESPARTLYAVTNDLGKKIYGRHTGLLPMRQLSDSDLVCFKLKAITELEAMIEILREH